MPELHDMGGRAEFFGPVEPEPDEPVFHERWEGRVFGMSGFVASLFGQNIDAMRFEMEQLPRDVYLGSYYGRWLGAFERKLVKAGYLGPDEVEARLRGERAQPGTRGAPRARIAVTARMMRWFSRPRLPRWLAARVLPRMIGSSRPTRRRPRFSAGDRVRVRSERSQGHTRQPGYVTGRPGTITAHHGATLLPDAHAVGRREPPQHLYTVAFEGRDLWGAGAEEATEVRIDLYEPYLESA